MAAIKINNAFENQVDLMKKLKAIKSKKKWDDICIKNIRSGNWFEVFRNLIYRIEYYSALKVLSYTKQDLIAISTFVKQKPDNLDIMAQQLADKAISSPAAVSQSLNAGPTKVDIDDQIKIKMIVDKALELEAAENYVIDVMNNTELLDGDDTDENVNLLSYEYCISQGYLQGLSDFYVDACSALGFSTSDFGDEGLEAVMDAFEQKYVGDGGASEADVDSIVSEDTPQAVATSLKNQVDPNFIRDVDEYVNQIYTAAIINGAYETLYKSAKLGEVTADYAEQVVSLNASTLIKPTAEIRIVAQIYDDYIAWCVKTVLEMLKQYPKIVMYSGGEVL